jgi:hypothetical protein
LIDHGCDSGIVTLVCGRKMLVGSANA